MKVRVDTLSAMNSRKISSLERFSRRSTSSGEGDSGDDGEEGVEEGVGERERGMRSMFWRASRIRHAVSYEVVITSRY